ncbi:MAG: hypothetical protein AB8C02_06200 [Halioglobus sp.]
MDMIADILMIAGAMGAAFYCFILGRRLKKFNNLEAGMGGAVATMAIQVEDLKKTISGSIENAQIASKDIESVTHRAEDVKRQLELQIAALHDIPLQKNAVQPEATTEILEVPQDHPRGDQQIMFARRQA